MSDFVVSDPEPTPKTRKKSRDESTEDSSRYAWFFIFLWQSKFSSDDEQPHNKSILSQLDPNLLGALRNDNSIRPEPFYTVTKLYIMDHLNSKTIDTVFKSTESEFEGTDNFRRALNTLDKSA